MVPRPVAICLQERNKQVLNIRNFCILAHVDHGKSTLCDRFLEITGTVKPSAMKPQYLDVNPISRERGITIKLAPVRIKYQLPAALRQIFNFDFFIFNLIDTPGHVDFAYEVSRSLAACEGAIFLVDATQGIQAQTFSYWQKAKAQGLKLIPVVNKIDLAAALPEEVALAMSQTFAFSQEEILFISAKTGEGVRELMKAVIERLPPPPTRKHFPLRALVFDSFYDQHKGVVVMVRVFDGEIKIGETLSLLASGAIFKPLEIGYFQPEPQASPVIENGNVGYLATGLKELNLARVGDTLTSVNLKTQKAELITPLPGYQPPKPMVFVAVYPLAQTDFHNLEESLAKLSLNDASFSYQPESSLALGKGFRMGFLGPLHAEVVKQRLEREFGLALLMTAPNVEYQVVVKKGRDSSKQTLKIRNISEIPQNYEAILEPMVKGTILTPPAALGRIIELCQEHRGKQLNIEYLGWQVKLEYRLPLAEILSDFFAKLKSFSSGYASFDYQVIDYALFDGVRLDIYIGGKMIEALSRLVPKNKAYEIGRTLVEKLFKVIPKQMFEFTIQAAVGKRVIARLVKKAWRKDVTAKLYGGDQTRKDKLLEKQKKGKKRMKAVGRVFIPQEAFLAVLKDEN